jgi:hypothetical protein
MTKGIPSVTDNDHGEITVSLDGKEMRGWSYQSEAEQRIKMMQAREYVEGWCDGHTKGQTELFLRSIHIRKEMFKLVGAIKGISKQELHEIVDRLVPPPA